MHEFHNLELRHAVAHTVHYTYTVHV